MLEQLILISSALVGCGEGTTELPLGTAMERIDAQLSAYCAERGFSYDSDVAPILSPSGEVTGFRTEINGEELTFDLDGYSMDASPSSEDPDYYASTLAGMTPLSDLISSNGFSVNSCICRIPSLVSIYGSSPFGNWTPVSFNCDIDDCAQIASLDLIYTYRLTNATNPSIYSSASALYSALQSSQNYQPGLGIVLSDYLPGLSATLTSSFQASSGSFNATKPVVCAYSPASGNVGHFAMKIGEAETTAFWFIKTKWDVVVSSNKNYIGTEPVMIDNTNEACFFGIEANRRQATFVLFGC
ncbi:MAG: hypothetical protein J6A47_06905 [Bacilli bacterium]|nr:hypothetical protein [Bacilli bacterium]MBO6286370.1 hypothetical protein [Bacilli bacterium]